MNSDSEEDNLIETSSEDELSSSEDESEDESLESARNWCGVDVSVLTPAPPKFPFTGNPGIKVSLRQSDDPLDYFCLFFDDEVISFIAKETNSFAEEHFSNLELTPSTRALQWKDVTSEELKRFISLLILQGIVQKPTEKWFWSKRPILCTPFFGNVMNEKRYSLIMKFLHFQSSNDSEDESPSNNKLKKIGKFHSMLMQRFQSTYIPKQDISIDESLIGYKGRLGWKQYIPTKRSRFGVKLFQLCESESGYIWNSIIYTGKGTTFHEDYEDYGVSTKSVMTLIHELKNKGYTLTTDSYYTSPELAEILIKCKTDIYGTLRANRKGLPPLIKSSKVKKGEVLPFQKGKICLLKWTDKKPILMLSTLHSTSMVTVESKKSKSSKLKSAVVADYNNTMGGVDKADQCLSYYPVARNQQRKYYKKIFRYLLSQAVWNAFVIFKKNGGKMRQVEFRMKLIERLIEVTVCNPSTRRGPFPKSEENVVRLTGRHFPSYVDESESRKKSRKCVVCSLKINENGKRVRRESRFECKNCNVGLCVAPCFEIYHTESNL
ncbi:PiggyBac transposable element-derived protein 4 [Araneus ventricosus]|uniref:PiggyBac transposable element-derived protein 4 n=2 Tax=Araneus ventricosus TaxID=182803 RepID=A0A4Y2NEW2_ARAVE|nr:PiggyBac transposable element-derived protein 4 [Araneus ventricosus]